MFVMDWTRPVPIEEYFLPLDDRLLFPDFRACLDVLELSRRASGARHFAACLLGR